MKSEFQIDDKRFNISALHATCSYRHLCRCEIPLSMCIRDFLWRPCMCGSGKIIIMPLEAKTIVGPPRTNQRRLPEAGGAATAHSGSKGPLAPSQNGSQLEHGSTLQLFGQSRITEPPR